MLLTQEHKDKVMSIKLVTGDEIIAKIVDESSEDFILERPLRLLLQPVDGQGNMSLTFAPIALAYNIDLVSTVSVYKHSVAFLHEAPAEIEKHYLAQASGIKLATQ